MVKHLTPHLLVSFLSKFIVFETFQKTLVEQRVIFFIYELIINKQRQLVKFSISLGHNVD